MSNHEVRVVRVENITKHPGADALEVVQIWGYQCLVRKGQFRNGELAAYIESDYTVGLNRPEFRFLDDGKGKTRQRITMRRFRGEASYGLLIPAPPGSVEGDNVMELLGVERWEPQGNHGGLGGGPTGFLSGICEPGPSMHVPHYDLENFRKYHRLFNEDDRVIYTTKIHGTSARYLFDQVGGERMMCGSRTTWKKRPGEMVKTVTFTDPETNLEVTKDIVAPENVWWKALEQNPWIEMWCRAHPGIALFGEVYGPNVQGTNFAYGKAQGEYGFAAFDVLDGGRWVDNGEVLDNPAYSDGMMEMVKVLYRGPLDRQLLMTLAEQGEDQIAYPGQKVREGVVVKLERGERHDPRLGRVALKFVSDTYLSMK